MRAFFPRLLALVGLTSTPADAARENVLANRSMFAGLSLGDRIDVQARRFSKRFVADRRRAVRELAAITANPFHLLHVITRPRVLLAALLVLVTFGKAAMAAPIAGVGGFIRHANRIDEMVTYTFTPAQDAGNRIFINLPPGGPALRHVQVKIDFNLAIAGAVATSIRNFGRAEALFTEMGIVGGGEGETWRADPRGLAFASQYMLQPGQNADNRMTSVAIGAYIGASMFRLAFENPQARVPNETLFLPKDASVPTQLFLTLSTRTTGAPASTIGAGELFNAPVGSTVTITNLRVTVEAYVDNKVDPSDPPSIFKPLVEQVPVALAAAVVRYPIDITLADSQCLRGITVMSLDPVTNELIQAFQEIGLKNSVESFISNGALVPGQNVARASQFEAGANLYSIYDLQAWHYNFQQRGELSACYNSQQGAMLQLFVTTTQACKVIVIKHLLNRDEYELVGPNGQILRRVTTKNPPAGLFGDPALAA